jgi:hypothetical protein
VLLLVLAASGFSDHFNCVSMGHIITGCIYSVALDRMVSCIVVVPQQVAYGMRQLLFCSILMQSYPAEVFVETLFDGVEVKRKMIINRPGKF